MLHFKFPALTSCGRNFFAGKKWMLMIIMN